MAAVRCAEQARCLGTAQKQVAASLSIAPRTLRHWKQRYRSDELAPRRRGRPRLACDVPTRNQVIRFLHEVTGPSVGLPALRVLFPDVPRCILEDLLRRYRRVWRRRYCQRGFRLTWHRPGAVWAIDFSEARHPVDGVYPYLLAIRDLASHRQLAWQPVASEKAEEAVPLLRRLFDEHGPPLVLKSDNGSAFIAHRTRETMLAAVVAQLFSPPKRPEYNGALERSNGMLKTYTHQHAIHQGHPFRWTSGDLEHARQLANTISRPWGHRGSTPQQAWNQRTPITEDERGAFQTALEQHRRQAGEDLGLDLSSELSVRDRARLDRLALSRTLDELGYLTKKCVPRPPNKPKRKSRAELARAAAELVTNSCTSPAASPSDGVLAQTDASAIMPAVGDAGVFRSNQCPTVTSTHWEWTLYS